MLFNANQREILIAFLQESLKNKPNYERNCDFKTLNMPHNEYGYAFKELYGQGLIYLSDSKQIVEGGDNNPPLMIILADARLTSNGRVVAESLQ